MGSLLLEIVDVRGISISMDIEASPSILSQAIVVFKNLLMIFNIETLFCCHHLGLCQQGMFASGDWGQMYCEEYINFFFHFHVICSRFSSTWNTIIGISFFLYKDEDNDHGFPQWCVVYALALWVPVWLSIMLIPENYRCIVHWVLLQLFHEMLESARLDVAPL